MRYSFAKSPKAKEASLTSKGDKASEVNVKSTESGNGSTVVRGGKEKEVREGAPKKRSRVIEDSNSESEDDDNVAMKKGRRDKEHNGSSFARKSKGDSTSDNEDQEEEEVEDVEMEEEEAEEEAEAEEEKKEKAKDGKAIKKLAAIFEKKAPTESEASWKQGEPVPYSALAQTFADIEATTKRLVILEILTNFFVKVIRLSPEDMLACVYLCINRLCPDYEGLELGIGESLLIKGIAQSTGRDVARLKKDLEQKGDLGLVAIVSCCKKIERYISLIRNCLTFF